MKHCCFVEDSNMAKVVKVQRAILTSALAPWGEHSTVLKNGGANRISPQGDKIHPRGTTSPLESKFVPRGEVKNGPLS
jgi:hypothetical protein